MTAGPIVVLPSERGKFGRAIEGSDVRRIRGSFAGSIAPRSISKGIAEIETTRHVENPSSAPTT